MKRKVLAMLLASAMVLSMTACGGKDNTNADTQTPAAEDSTEAPDADAAEDSTEPAASGSGETYRAALLLNGTLGDKSFYDSANEGLTRLKEELGADAFDFKVEQMGGTTADEAKWEPTLLDYCDSGEYDVIIMGTWQMKEPLANAAEEYPDQKFIFFDEDFRPSEDEPDEVKENFVFPSNIYNVLYKQNEVSYLVGAAAAMMTTDETIPNIDPSTKDIGFLGGMNNAVINDFLKGYEQGAKDIDPEIKVQVSWVGDFVDSTRGKDLALAQYQNGVDVGFNVAGNAGLGQIEAAGDMDLYAFGVDSDQATLLPDYAKNIPTSALKKVGNSLYRAIKLDLEGNLAYGTVEVLGFAEDGVELVKDAHYEEMLPESIRTKLDELEQKIINGEIVVETTIAK